MMLVVRYIWFWVLNFFCMVGNFLVILFIVFVIVWELGVMNGVIVEIVWFGNFEEWKIVVMMLILLRLSLIFFRIFFGLMMDLL